MPRTVPPVSDDLPPPTISAKLWPNAPAHKAAWVTLVSRRLHQVRRRLQLAHGDAYSARSVAKALGRSSTWLSNLENGHRRIDVTTLRILATVYGVDPGVLIAEPVTAHEQSDYEGLVRAGELAAAESARLDAEEEAHRRRKRR